MESNTTAQGTSSSEFLARLDACRRNAHISSLRDAVAKNSLEDIKAIAMQKIRENCKEADYTAWQNMSPEQRLQKQADDYNATPGTLQDFDCQVCHNKGFVQVVRDTEIVTRECKCMVTRRTWHRIHESGLELELKQKRFENYDHSSSWQAYVYDKARKYLEDTLSGGTHWMAVCGQTGAGKTHICTAVVGQLIKSGRGAIYMPYRDEIMRIKQAAGEAAEYQPRMEQFKQADVLYIDDLFKGKITDADINAVYEIVGYRYSNRKTTIFSTEVLWERLNEIDGAIAGRINEMSGEYLIPIAPDASKNRRLQGENHDGQ